MSVAEVFPGGLPLKVTIPGEPCSQGRPRFSVVHGRFRAYDPSKSRNWKAAATDAMVEAAPSPGQINFPAGPLAVRIEAVFSCPKGDWRKKGEPTPRRRHAKRGDPDNIAKAVLDAATSAGLWSDDAQVARLVVEKWIGAQGEAPHVVVEVAPLVDRPCGAPDDFSPRVCDLPTGHEAHNDSSIPPPQPKLWEEPNA